MSEQIKRAVIDVIAFISDEFIVEECVGNLTDGCLSCEMIEARASLRKVLEIIDEPDGSVLYPPNPTP